MIVANGHQFRTLADKFYVNGARVTKAYANGVQVYPDHGCYVRVFGTMSIVDTHYHDLHGGQSGTILDMNIYYDHRLVCSATYHATASIQAVLWCKDGINVGDYVTTKYGKANDPHMSANRSPYWLTRHAASGVMNDQEMWGLALKPGKGSLTLLEKQLYVTASVPTCGPITFEQRHEGYFPGYDGTHSVMASGGTTIHADDTTVSLRSGSGGIVGFDLRGTAKIDYMHTFTSYDGNGKVANVTFDPFTDNESLFLGCIPITTVQYIGDDPNEAAILRGSPTWET